MRVAVTGSSGFIGRHVVRQLAARRGIDVIAIARHPDASISPSVTPVELDIGADNAHMYDSIGRPDVLLHLAWSGLPDYRAATHLESELPRQIGFLDACVNAGLRRLVVAGTCLEYGMQSGCLDESLRTAPITAYGQAKDRLREHLDACVAADGLQLAWARLFYLYGPGQAPTSLYSQLRTAVEAGATEFPMSPGDQQRDFLPIDAAAAYLCALALEAPDAGVVNVCGGTAKPVVSWARAWLSEWGADLTLKLGVYPYPEYEPHAFWGSTMKLHSLLGTP
ncbi:NAD-dependent epimerase/dehydratase family protein [Thermomonas sp.]|uniref:NAD-dependent epimerase/dehydratase family protein n=1 Tax=Thermomonas sp. TaxID=1971895 RepID=UPI002487105B|nr:NAD-dependent epimerase/dehydratase family protein [Thermomonas sp.]MDI1254303.1 NAD-dependent epimerase/dehydratase family protein [Thermomonas sp.]